MSTPSYYTSAGNFISSVQGSVDPRTGLFNVHLPLANIQANALMGPTLSLDLQYSPLSTVDSGFGKGFRLNLSRYDKNTRQLLLSNGEEYRMGNNNQVQQQKLKNFIFEKLDENTCQIIYKSGLIEHLSLRSGEIYVPSQIASADGRTMNLTWDSFSPARLTRVTDDEGTILCSVSYPDVTSADTIFTLLPKKANLSYKINFKLYNGALERVTSKVVNPALEWIFKYEFIDPQERYRVITAVHSPTGLIEKVSYYTQAEEGMAFPDIANLTPLPCVRQHMLIPGAVHTQSITKWSYTQKNYLGKDAPLNQWQPDQDHMLNILLADYQYGSTAEHQNADRVTLSKVTRRYNSYHLLVSETTVRDGKQYVSETEYYAKKGAAFNDQPTQYVLPKKQTESWFDLSKQDVTSSRTLVTRYQFDEFGNPAHQEASDGTISDYAYYPAIGEGSNCPADPHGFTRYLKTLTVTPPKKSGNEPARLTRYRWQKLEPLRSTGNAVLSFLIRRKSKSKSNRYAVVQKTIEQTTGYTRILTNNTYYSDKTLSSLYGRIYGQEITLTPDINQAKTFTSAEIFTYDICKASDHIVENREFRGHDGLTAKKKACRHMRTGKVMSKTDPQGVETLYCYDTLGRITRRTLCPNSEYESITSWEYGINKEDGVYSIETDASGNKNKARFDGAGRAIKKHRFDVDTAAWYTGAICIHNPLGEVISCTVRDWLPGGADVIPLTSNITYGGWGEKKEVAFSDGRKALQQTDPITLTQTVFSQGTGMTSGSTTTRLDEKSQLLISSVLKEHPSDGQQYSSTHYTWDGLGQLRKEEDELGRITERTYDEYGRVLTQILPDGTTVSRTYAPHLTGNQVASISVTGPDVKGTFRTWELGTQTFDSLGRITKRVSGGRGTSYSYQGVAPAPSTVTLPSGKTVEYTYIPALGNAVSSMKADSIRQRFEYDKKTGKLLKAQEASSKIKNTWSQAGQLKEEVFVYNGQNRKVKYTHTLNGAPVSYTDITGKQMQYSMDANGRVTHITDDTLIVSLAYDTLGQLIKQTVHDTGFTSWLTTAIDYDSFGREITRTLMDNSQLTLVLSQTWKKNGLLATRATQRNNVELRKEQYGYDNRNRLVSYCVSGSSLPVDAYGNLMTGQNYTYDALNNLTSVFTWLSDGRANQARYSYDNSSDPMQLTKVTNSHPDYPADMSLTYDAEGRMTRDESGRTLTYDVLGRLTGVSGNNGHSGTYGYDALNRLSIRKAGKKDVRELYYRGAELVNEVTASTNIETRLIKTGHTCVGVSDDKGLTLTAGDKNNSLLWSEDVGNSGKEGQFYVWSPYGSGKPDSKLPGFNGERFDPVSGTYHLGNGYRAYNPVLMRFNCPDSLSPFGAGGINPYAYCAGDPINHTDPSGHISWQSIVGIVAGAIGLAFAAFTAGSSIAAAGGVMAALSSEAAASIAIGGLGVASDITGIVSGATEDSDPEASSIIGWVSMAIGLAGMAAGIGGASHGKYTGYRNRPNNLQGRSIREALFDGVDDAVVQKLNNKRIKPKWHMIEHNNALKFGADAQIRGSYIIDPINYLAGIEGDERKILILSGGHGDPHGSNWIRVNDSVRRPLPRIIRDPSLHDPDFWIEDVERFLGSQAYKSLRSRISVVDISRISVYKFAEHIHSDSHVILGFCFGRNDKALRYYLGLNSVISYKNPRLL